MGDQVHRFPVASKVTLKRDCYGAVIGGVAYGSLPAGAQGTVVDHTQDGRAIIDFGALGTHTFHNPEILEGEISAFDRVTAERDDLAAKLEAAHHELRIRLGLGERLEPVQHGEQVGAFVLGEADGRPALIYAAPGFRHVFYLPDWLRLYRQR